MESVSEFSEYVYQHRMAWRITMSIECAKALGVCIAVFGNVPELIAAMEKSLDAAQRMLDELREHLEREDDE